MHAHARSTAAAGFQGKCDSIVWRRGCPPAATAGLCLGLRLPPRCGCVHRRDPRSPPSAASLLQANVVCVVYDVTKEATIEKVTVLLPEP